ncbi:MAG: phenylacetate--CoA ligase [Actinobacteria bacterium]|nr:phenylacetate--CoA ligase [Actinomycetota bacterium]MCG2820075.1 phenylacetate--CoA ligase [Actinomycetes bacterium]MBU4218974.1 phenylacetate--CoA ligase [Actinomycetota bacterium]MBU4359162.1 phenylacetate--CoA ligase [Actinomycetota bacterium]MBU4392319.1 phenylacetate--CoA ligase [Actinomycetota bacterium]
MYNPEIETMDREEIASLQLERLKATVKRCEEKVPFYRKKLRDAGVSWKDIKALDDVEKLPFTTKSDLRDNYPFGMFAVPTRDIVRIHASSGTTGQPTVVGYTARDIDVWSELMARSIVVGMGEKTDIIQVAYGYGLFTGGLGFHYGVERLGASAIPISGGNTKRQIRVMVDLGTTILCCTPSYALFMAETAAEMGVDFKQLKLKSGIFGAEPWSDQMRDKVERLLNLSAFDIYGLSEVMGPGVSIECEQKKGLHIFEDAFLAEIINPESGKRLAVGEQGELVFTTLNKEGLPLLRYRTRDITSLDDTPCECGRTHVRMRRVRGRTDDMLIIRGVNVFPSQIESVLMEIEGVSPHYQLIVDREAGLDILEVQVEVSEEMFSDRIQGLEEWQDVIRGEIQSYLGIGVKVILVEPRSLARSEGKAVRVVDNREV